MRYSDEYLAIKKIAVTEAIAEMVMKNIDCWNADLEGIVNTRAGVVIEEIGKVLASGKADDKTVEEIRKIFDNHKLSYKK